MLDIKTLFERAEKEFKVGERIKKLRRNKKWTQVDLAERIGVSSQVISNWEREYTDPDPADFSKLASVFGVSTDYLILGFEEHEIKDMRLIKRTESPLVDKLLGYIQDKNNKILLSNLLEGKIAIDEILNETKLAVSYNNKTLSKADRQKVKDLLKVLFEK